MCRKTGKQFGEFLEHFIIVSDETNLIADADGDVKRRMERLCSKLLSEKSLEHAKAIEDEEAVHNNNEEEGDLNTLLPKALEMYTGIKGGGKLPRKLTKKHISAILLLCFNFCVSGNTDKMIAALDEVSAANPSKLTS